MLLCPNPKCDDIGGKSKYCPKCGFTRETVPNDEGIPCGGIKDDRSTCNEEIKRTQNFCQACGTKINKERFRQDICNFCQCVLTSGSRFCHMCGAMREWLQIGEDIPCGGIKDDQSTCNEKIKRTQNFCQACGKKIDKERFIQDICNFCQCVLTSGSRFCHMCGATREWLKIKEDILCGGSQDGRSTCNERVNRSQIFCQACGTKVDKERFRQDVCSFCQCVLSSGSRFCSMCGTNTVELKIVGSDKNAADGIKQLSLTNEKEVQSQTVTGASHVIREPMELSDKNESDTISGPGLSADEMKQMEIAAQGGVLKVQEYIKARKHERKLIQLHIAVTGNSGVGKSSFINSLRGVKKGQIGFADVDVNETTTTLKGYPHPKNKSLVFWDMPGVGTPEHPRADYLETVQFEKYDFFLILTCGRFTENDLWLANAIRNQNKTFYFIRTKIDFDVYNARQTDPDLRESDVIAKIRKDCIAKFGRQNFEDPSVFLIDNNKFNKYDSGTLVDTLLGNLPETKREAMALSLTLMTKTVIMAKKYALQKRIFFISVASAIGGAVPIPGVATAIDTAIIRNEADEYKRQFGLTDEALLKHSPKHADVIRRKYAPNIAQLIAAVTVDEAEANAAKYKIPPLGSILSGTLSYGVCVTVLWKLLNLMADDALRLNEDMIQSSSSVTDV